jgi:hypothetical protein
VNKSDILTMTSSGAKSRRLYNKRIFKNHETAKNWDPRSISLWRRKRRRVACCCMSIMGDKGAPPSSPLLSRWASLASMSVMLM